MDMLFSCITCRTLLGQKSSSDSSPLGPANSAPTSSNSSNTIQNHRFDVFISFRGSDTRNTFVDHLYAHLTRKGIFVFKDDKKLHKGKSISSQLIQAIQDSRVSIIVFSKDYAASTWCLDEMATITDCQQQSNQTVFPVFYDVDPSHVRYHNGVYENAFVLHKRKFKQDPEKVHRWERAMTRLASSAGWDETCFHNSIIRLSEYVFKNDQTSSFSFALMHLFYLSDCSFNLEDDFFVY